MSETQTFEKIKKLKPNSAQRREAVRAFLLGKTRDFVANIAAKANVDRSMVSKVLHGHSFSASVDAALLASEAKTSKANS